jgi:hypothetical protein
MGRPGPSAVDPARQTRLLKRAVIVDLHDDTTQMIVDKGYSLVEKHDFGRADMRAGQSPASSSRSGPIPTAALHRIHPLVRE